MIDADKIAVMHNGALVEEGNHQTLIAKGGVYARLVQKQIARQSSVIEEGQVSMQSDRTA